MSQFNISRRSLLGAGAASVAALGAAKAFSKPVLGSYTASNRPFDITALPILSVEQAGHIRHIRNVSKNLPNTWIHMKGPIDHMGGGTGPALYKVVPHTHFALMLGHLNRLPAAPGVFRDTSHRLIKQALDKEVWGYWALMSTSGVQYDPDLEKPRKPWQDPVVNENIMYSARLTMMLGMHSNLFNDNTYERPDSVVLDWDVPFSGGPTKFTYSLDSLADRMYCQLVESGYLGFPCEPNCVFVVCNQYGLIAQRLNDLRRGTNRAEESAAAFMDAWERKGLQNDVGHLAVMYRPNQDMVMPFGSPMWSLYAGTYMSAWNPEFVRENYPNWTKYAWRKGPSGTLSPWPSQVLDKVRAAVDSGRSPAGIDVTALHIKGMTDIGQMAVCAAEIGDSETLTGLLAHVDMFNQPTWEDGGLYYPRRDESWDKKGNMIKMDPWTGTGGIAHARLTVEGGLTNIWNFNWAKDHFTQPALAEVSEDLDFLRGVYLPEKNALVWTVQTWHGGNINAQFAITNADRPDQSWTLYRDGEVIGSGTGKSVTTGKETGLAWRDEKLHLSAQVGKLSDFVLIWA